MKRDDAVYLQHVADAITKIETYLTGFDESYDLPELKSAVATLLAALADR
jgi:uncharacterized protein with HEPN domain